MAKNIYLCLLLFALAACKTNEESLIQLIETQYANLTINHPGQKNTALNNLKTYFQTKSLSDDNLDEISAILNQFKDGHIYISGTKSLPKLATSITFYPGANYIKSCEACTPKIPTGKYELVNVDGKKMDDWLNDNKYQVAASTEQGRHFRELRLLTFADKQIAKSITVKNHMGKLLESQLNWTAAQSNDECVHGERLNDKTYLLLVKNFWCIKANVNLSREATFERFKNLFDLAIKPITKDDHIILDLRENGGGADLEVEYLLNAFLRQSTYLYTYQHLLINAESIWKRALAHLPFSIHLWANKIKEFTHLENSPPDHFFDNKLTLLISAGCFSSCEVVAQALKYEKRALLWGERTHGGAGDPNLFPISNTGFFINLPTCHIWQKDGSLFEGVGVAPDIDYVSSFSLVGDDLLLNAQQ